MAAQRADAEAYLATLDISPRLQRICASPLSPQVMKNRIMFRQPGPAFKV
jgi:hypothetical protein